MKRLGGRARAAGSTCDICDEVLLMCDHVAEEHLKASLVHLLQVGQEGFSSVLVPQDIVCLRSQCTRPLLCSTAAAWMTACVAARRSHGIHLQQTVAVLRLWGLRSTSTSDILCQSKGHTHISCTCFVHAPRMYLLMSLREPKVFSCT